MTLIHSSISHISQEQKGMYHKMRTLCDISIEYIGNGVRQAKLIATQRM